MTPRRLDELLAVNLFGWTRVEYHPGTSKVAGWCHGRPPKGTDTLGLSGTGTGLFHIERYSSTWDGLGEVVLAMAARGYTLTLIVSPLDKLAHATYSKDDSLWRTESRPEAPMSVAIAALRALGVEV